WALTLLCAPFITDIIEYFFNEDTNSHWALIAFYPYTIMLSFILSIPTLLIYSLTFFILQKYNVSYKISKAALLLLCLI
ncbi:hypothetical protein ACO1MP_14735, partial [Staphylococcus aureus]